MDNNLRLAKKTLEVSMQNDLTIGITYDTKDDFKFNGDEPSDWDAEFQVSLAVDDITRALEDLGHKTIHIGSGRKLLDNFTEYENKMDIIFNIAEGKFGRSREAQVPALLEMVGIPFVGSDAYALSVSLNKWHTKAIANYHGIRTPSFTVIENLDLFDDTKIPKFPVIAKLCYEGSSMGLDEKAKIFDLVDLKSQVKYLLKTYKQPVIIEEFIVGTEVDVPIIGNNPSEVFGVVGISFDEHEMGERFLTSDVVYKDDYCFHYPLNKSFETETARMSLDLYNILGCRDFGRVDMRIDKNGTPYMLEINPYPYLGRHSSFNHIAEKKNMKYKDVIGMILNSAISRYS